MARLPQPGSDNGTWGDILNDFLMQALNSDGNIKDDAVTANTIAPNAVTNDAIATDAVNASSIANGSITEALLDSDVQAKLNAANPTDIVHISGSQTITGDKSFSGIVRVIPKDPLVIPAVYIDNTNVNQEWSLFVNGNSQFGIYDETNATGPFRIYPNTPTDTFVLNETGMSTSQPVDMNNNKIVEVANPTAEQDAATKNYVDSGSAILTNKTIHGLNLAISSKTANYTLIATDHTVLFDATSGNRTATLPAAAGATGRVYVVKKIDSSANIVTVDPNGSETIDGASTKVLSTPWESVTIQSTGSSWVIL